MVQEEISYAQSLETMNEEDLKDECARLQKKLAMLNVQQLTQTKPIELNDSLVTIQVNNVVSVKLTVDVCNELQRYMDKHKAKEGYGVANDWHWLEQAIIILYEHCGHEMLTIKADNVILDFFRWGKWEEICDTLKQ